MVSILSFLIELELLLSLNYCCYLSSKRLRNLVFSHGNVKMNPDFQLTVVAMAVEDPLGCFLSGWLWIPNPVRRLALRWP